MVIHPILGIRMYNMYIKPHFNDWMTMPYRKTTLVLTMAHMC